MNIYDRQSRRNHHINKTWFNVDLTMRIGDIITILTVIIAILALYWQSRSVINTEQALEDRVIEVQLLAKSLDSTAVVLDKTIDSLNNIALTLEETQDSVFAEKITRINGETEIMYSIADAIGLSNDLNRLSDERMTASAELQYTYLSYLSFSFTAFAQLVSNSIDSSNVVYKTLIRLLSDIGYSLMETFHIHIQYSKELKGYLEEDSQRIEDINKMHPSENTLECVKRRNKELIDFVDDWSTRRNNALDPPAQKIKIAMDSLNIIVVNTQQ